MRCGWAGEYNYYRRWRFAMPPRVLDHSSSRASLRASLKQPKEIYERTRSTRLSMACEESGLNDWKRVVSAVTRADSVTTARYVANQRSGDLNEDYRSRCAQRETRTRLPVLRGLIPRCPDTREHKGTERKKLRREL